MRTLRNRLSVKPIQPVDGDRRLTKPRTHVRCYPTPYEKESHRERESNRHTPTTGQRVGHNLKPRSGPLRGIKVLDISTVYAAPITAMLLGDFGADVIKVEHPKVTPPATHGWDRDGHGLWWKVISRNKQTMTLNLSHPTGQEILRELAAEADVLVENFRPGVLEKWGIGADTLLDINPRLVMLRVTGFGQSGPYAEPARVRHPRRGDEWLRPPDRAAGRATHPAAVRARRWCRRDYRRLRHDGRAVRKRRQRRSRAGRRSLPVGASCRHPRPRTHRVGPVGYVAERHGNRSPNNAPRNTYLTRDGRWVAISASATSVAERVMCLVGRPDIAAEPWFDNAGERSRRADLIDGLVAAWIAARDYEDVSEQFVDAGAALAPIYDVEQLLADPHVIEREVITTVDDEDLGPLRMQNVMCRFSDTPGSIEFAGRRLGQDNESSTAPSWASTSRRSRRTRRQRALYDRPQLSVCART